MGTGADFYVGRGEHAEWLGSIAYDGYPEGIPDSIRKAKNQRAYKAAVTRFLKSKKHATFPADGWPWLWENSQTTDYAYAFDKQRVYGSCFGHKWFPASRRQPDHDGSDEEKVTFPDMTSRMKVATPGSERSGVMVLGFK